MPVLTQRLACRSNMGMFRCGVCEAPARSAMRDFVTSQYAMNYVHRGTGYYLEANGARHPLRQGSVLRRFPNIKHTVGWSTEAVFGIIALPSQAWELLQLTGLGRSDRRVFQIQPDAALPERFEDLAHALAKAPEHDFSAVFLEMLSFMAELHKREEDSPVQPHDPVIISAMARLSTDVSERITMPQLASELGVGYSSFRKRFRRQVGISPGSFQMQRRIERSLNLLSDSSRTISEIAEALGYPDLYTFSTQYKRVVGVSPQTWRKMNGL